ncbi:hypothetical protein [Methylocaldum sp.]|uniref:hypothetical protein n=1 Tax=Methylocaldum sp. TaxID=1969727 RepID=UPI002D472786|nr:hypothetical protein [Methylocaldum sp.]HYE36370.1 hypothetical protein [Methylocaldum sp.]
MKKGRLIASSLTLLFLSGSFVQAVEKPGTEETQQEEQFSEPVQELTDKARTVQVFSHIYGADLMSEKERCEYLLKLDSTKDRAERDKIRAGHRTYIDERKKRLGG